MFRQFRQTETPKWAGCRDQRHPQTKSFQLHLRTSTALFHKWLQQCLVVSNPTKEVRMTTQGEDSHFSRGCCYEWEKLGSCHIQIRKHGRKERQMLFMFQTCFLTIWFLILTSFEGIFGRLSSCNDMFLVGVAIVFGLAPYVTDWELESSLIIWQKRRGFMGGKWSCDVPGWVVERNNLKFIVESGEWIRAI